MAGRDSVGKILSFGQTIEEAGDMVVEMNSSRAG